MSSNILSDLFPSVLLFGKYVPYLEANTNFDNLNASALPASKQIKIIITSGIYDSISAEADTSEKREALRGALANLTMSKQLSFDVITRRKQNIETYKYEVEQMKRDLMQGYFNAMDTLISLLNEEKSAAWQATDYCKKLKLLKIQTTEEFDSIYPIDLSYLFFFRCIPWQKEVLDEKLGGLFSRAEGNESEIPLLKRALCKYTIAKALRRFDILQFPEVIRGLFLDAKPSRTGESEQTQILRLADQLTAEADLLVSGIELALNESGTNIVSTTSFNRPEDKIYLLS